MNSASSQLCRLVCWLALALPSLAHAQEGTLKWGFFTSGAVYSSPALSNSGSSGYSIYVGSEGTTLNPSRLYSVTPAGGLTWQFGAFNVTDWIDSCPAVGDNGVIYFGSWDGRLRAVNPGGGQRWSFTATGFIASSAAIATDGTVYFGSGDRTLYALNSDGSLKWSYLVADWVDSSPAIGPEGTVYFGSYDNNVYALRADGTLRWQFTTGDSVASSPAIGADATVYIGSNDGKLYALDGATGALKWSYTTGGSIAASPVVGPDGTIYVGSLDGYFYAINSSGALVWRFNAGVEIYSSAALRADGVILFGAYFHVYALNSDGTQRWRYATGDYVDSSPVIAGDGTIYVGSSDKRLIALNGNGQGPATAAPWPMFRQNVQRNGRSPVTAFPTGGAAPSITAHPVSQTVTAGGSATFTVGASGNSPLSYQWFKGTDSIAGATAATYTLNPVQSADAGSYSVRVSNANGAVFSNAATLTVGTTVIGPSIITAPATQTVSFGDSVALTVTLSGTSPFGFQWYKDDAPLIGANSASYVINSATFADAGNYAVLISNNAGSAAAYATLTVTKRAQTISFTRPADQGFSFFSVPLSATASSGLTPTLTLVSGPATLTGSSLTLTGLGTVTVRADQAGNSNYAAAPSVTRSFTVSTSYDYWLVQNFTAEEISAGTLTAPSASAAADGVPNLVKYALGLAPKSAASASLPLPTANESTTWALTYTRPSDRTDVSVTVEFSNDLATWTTATSSLVSSSDGTDTWSATVPRITTPNVFFRIVVVRP